jgi:hypothetical protein
VLCIFFCAGNCAKKEARPLPSLIGTWQNKNDPGKKPVLIFKTDTTYILEFKEGKLSFPGRYAVMGKRLMMVDLYCGTALPGLYDYSVGKKRLTLINAGDSLCDRKLFFPGTWERAGE